MIKFLKTISLASIILLASCKQDKTTSYQLVDVTNFELAINQPQNIQLIDVRTPEEYEEGHIDDAININWNAVDFEQQITNLDKNEPIYLYCLSGGRSKKASDKLVELGFTNVIELEGGYMNWSKTHQPTGQNDQYTLNDFNKMVSQQPIVLVDFYADWCAPCKKMAPFIEQFKTDYQEKVTVLKIDADKNKQLVATLGYEALPIIIIYKNGEKVFEQQGFVDENKLRDLLNAQLK